MSSADGPTEIIRGNLSQESAKVEFRPGTGNMNVLILYNSPAQDALADEQDVMAQVVAVERALQELGHKVSRFACSLDLNATRQKILDTTPDAVFNLVESLAFTDRLAPMITLLLDALSVPYTGSLAIPLQQACGKITTKELLRNSGLPTADWLNGSKFATPSASAELFGKLGHVDMAQVIVKPVWEHASFGMDDSSVFVGQTQQEIRAALLQREDTTGRPWFAERFVEGREFNISVLQASGNNEVCQILPHAEILFVDFPANRPHIVGHSAKWDDRSIEYHQTPRRFDFSADDRELLNELSRLTVECWNLFELSGYARVDFRVDHEGQPWILEINANPCLTPDAGFANTADRAGLSYVALIERILQAASFSAT